MYSSQVDTKIDLGSQLPPPKTSKLEQWMKSNEDKALQLEQFISHRKIIRRWNRLSRFQRSLVYGFIVITVTVIMLLYTSQGENAESKNKKKMEQ
ncbi:jg39, partial [Pararge aegeria aegeria]